LLSPETERLVRYFTGRFPPDEAVCHTILGNAPELNICTESRHYLCWQKGNHPRLLERRDLSQMLASSAHFARKFAHGDPVLDALDEHLGLVRQKVNACAL
jgi:hypothetical protein